jgi:hypothetical protein
MSTLTVGLLWWSFTEGLLSSWAVRVGLGLFELRLRRKAYVWTERKAGRGTPEFVPNYTVAELARLCGLPTKRVNAALGELTGLGLLEEFSPTEVRFARSGKGLKLSDGHRSSFRSWFDLLTRRRYVPIPRRALVLACESGSKAQVATILGVCLRCSWLRPGQGMSLTGRVSCSWLARRFGLSPRAIENAKAHLVALGWIERTGNITTLGEVLRINPAWERLAATTPECVPTNGDTQPDRPSGTKSAGVGSPSGTKPAGVFLTPESPPPEEIQKPGRKSPGAIAPAGPGPGISNRNQGIKDQDPPATLPPPRLSSIRAEDLRDTGRALELFRQATKCGLLNGSENSRLKWLAAIERARTVGARNPTGVLLHIVKARKWDYLSDGHYEAAAARLRAFFNARPPGAMPFLAPRPATPERPPERARPQLSKDAWLVKLVGQKVRGSTNVFAAIRQHAGWDHARYAAAVRELEGAEGPYSRGGAHAV